MQSVLCSLELVWKTGGRCYISVINELRENKHEVSYEVKNCRSAAAVDVRWENVRVNDREENSPPGRGGVGQGSTQYMWLGGLFWLGLLFFTPTPAHHPLLCHFTHSTSLLSVSGSTLESEQGGVCSLTPDEARSINLKPNGKNTPAVLSSAP